MADQKPARAPRLPRKIPKVPVTLLVPLEVIEAIDARIQSGGRSAFIVAALREKLGRESA
jgi:hypothetical protein